MYSSCLHFFSNQEYAFVISKFGILYKLTVKRRGAYEFDEIGNGYENIKFVACDEKKCYFIDEIGMLFILDIGTKKVTFKHTSFKNIKSIYCSEGKFFVTTYE